MKRKRSVLQMHKIYNRIVQIARDVVTVEAKDIGYKDMAEITLRTGKSLAQVIRMDGEKIYLQVFAGARGVSTGDKVRFLGHAMRVSSSENLLGRIFNGAGWRAVQRNPCTYCNAGRSRFNNSGRDGIKV